MTATEKFKRAESLFQDKTKRELAEMVVHREGDLEDARAENARLRELGEQYETVLADYRSEVAKLRELCRYLRPFAESCGAEHPLMRELVGIEVDE